MPMKPANAWVYDTSADYRKLRVSYGTSVQSTLLLSDGTNTKFDANKLADYAYLQEENLIHCKYLNLKESSIRRLGVRYLTELRILVLWKTEIRVLKA